MYWDWNTICTSIKAAGGQCLSPLCRLLPLHKAQQAHLEINSLGRLHCAHEKRPTGCMSVQFGHTLFQFLLLHFIYLCFPHYDFATGWQLYSDSKKGKKEETKHGRQKARKKHECRDVDICHSTFNFKLNLECSQGNQCLNVCNIFQLMEKTCKAQNKQNAPTHLQRVMEERPSLYYSLPDTVCLKVILCI